MCALLKLIFDISVTQVVKVENGFFSVGLEIRQLTSPLKDKVMREQPVPSTNTILRPTKEFKEKSKKGKKNKTLEKSISDSNLLRYRKPVKLPTSFESILLAPTPKAAKSGLNKTNKPRIDSVNTVASTDTRVSALAPPAQFNLGKSEDDIKNMNENEINGAYLQTEPALLAEEMSGLPMNKKKADKVNYDAVKAQDDLSKIQLDKELREERLKNRGKCCTIS